MATMVKHPPTRAEAVRAVLEAMTTAIDAMRALLVGMEDEPSQTEALTPKQAARELGVSTASVRNLVKTGRIEAEFHGPDFYRISRASLEGYRRRITTKASR